MSRRGVGRSYQKDLQKWTCQDTDYDDRRRDELDYGLYPGDLFRPNAPTLLDSARAEQILTDNYLNKRFKQRKLEKVKAEENDELFMPLEIVRAMRGVPLKSKKRKRYGQRGESRSGLSALEMLERNGEVDERGNEIRDDHAGGGNRDQDEEGDEEEAEVADEDNDDDYGVDYYASDGDYGGDEDGGNDPYF